MTMNNMTTSKSKLVDANGNAVCLDCWFAENLCVCPDVKAVSKKTGNSFFNKATAKLGVAKEIVVENAYDAAATLKNDAKNAKTELSDDGRGVVMAWKVISTFGKWVIIGTLVAITGGIALLFVLKGKK